MWICVLLLDCAYIANTVFYSVLLANSVNWRWFHELQHCFDRWLWKLYLPLFSKVLQDLIEFGKRQKNCFRNNTVYASFYLLCAYLCVHQFLYRGMESCLIFIAMCSTRLLRNACLTFDCRLLGKNPPSPFSDGRFSFASSTFPSLLADFS